MALSPQGFRKRFHDRLIALHWRHWAAFGLSSQVMPENRYPLDLEALTVSTMAMAKADLRLRNGAEEWLAANRDWVNLSRLKRIGKKFENLPQGEGETLVSSLQHRSFRRPAGNLKVGKPNLGSLSLLQLTLRGIFGVDARVETMLFLLAKGEGNSNLISKAVHSDQKNIYRILEQWGEAGMGTPGKGFTLTRPQAWLDLLGIQEPPKWVNWVEVYGFLHAVEKACKEEDDEYMLASRFRDLLPGATSVFKDLGSQLPSHRNHPGGKYFEPFGMAVLQAIG